MEIGKALSGLIRTKTFSPKENMKIFIGSWNVNARVGKQLERWLKDSQSADIIIIGYSLYIYIIDDLIKHIFKVCKR